MKLDLRTILLLLLALVVSGVIAWIRVSTMPSTTAAPRRAAPSAPSSAPDAGYTVEVEVGP